VTKEQSHILKRRASSHARWYINHVATGTRHYEVV